MPLNYHDTGILKLNSPGFSATLVDHPIIHNLNNPVFKRIITFTDQAIMILNHSRFRYDYVSENIVNICGISSSTFLEQGADLVRSLRHPDDVLYLNTVIYPEYYRCIAMVPPSGRMNLKFSHTFRIKKSDGAYIQCVQQSIPLSFEGDDLLLELLVITDISAFKKDNRVGYKAILVEGVQHTRVLSQGFCDNRIFSTREAEVLKMTARGLSEKQIADRLSLSLYTIKTHRKNMFRKSGVKNSAELVRYGMANLLI